MQELQLLNDKLDMLLKKYAAAQTENKRLKETVAEQTRTIEELNSKLSDLEQNLTAVQVSRSAVTGEEKNKMKLQLDNVIGEIDKILTTLDD
jgi:uncharacterized coiled-coil protein SlyX